LQTITKDQRTKHRSAGVVVVLKRPDGWRYLMLRAYRNWDFPKGLVEPTETPIETAIRETREETSLSDLRFDWGEDYCETAPYAGSKVAHYYLVQTFSGAVMLPVSPELGRPEHHEYRWVTYEEARSLLPLRLLPILEWAREKLG
jgi:8-oxo-dGTP pyrophosphatase MutT (NUDIX family)